jgi:hypothetical protein
VEFSDEVQPQVSPDKDAPHEEGASSEPARPLDMESLMEEEPLLRKVLDIFEGKIETIRQT